MSTAEYTVSGMSCGHCEASVRAAVGRLEGIRHLEVSASSGSLVITSDSPIDEQSVRHAVSEAGYQAVRS